MRAIFSSHRGSPEAENLENLPGGADYYVNQAKGKSEAWIAQFLKAQWGFSVAGKPVVPTFQSGLHLSKGLSSTILTCRLWEGLIPG
jgi:hypothetical protein